MSSPIPPSNDRRQARRGASHLLWDLVYGGLRLAARHARGYYLTLGLFLLAAGAVAIAATVAFAKLATYVRSGRTQALDEGILHLIQQYHQPIVQHAMLEITFLGTGTVVLMVVAVSGAFLWLSRQRHAALLLIVSTTGGIVLNNVLKFTFDRPRPQLFAWGTQVASSSFPSGHAMSAAVVYGTVAYLLTRLQRTKTARLMTLLLAAILIFLISLSRLYLGVHYPSDVLAGVTIGLGWAAFCMATLEAVQRISLRSLAARPTELPDERRTGDRRHEEQRAIDRLVARTDPIAAPNVTDVP